MLSVNRISKIYADNVVLRDVSFIVNPGERVGLVGPNGSGKTTLLRILLGQEAADAGAVQFAPGLRVGYLSQGFDAPPAATLQTCLDAALGQRAQIEAEVEQLAAALAASPHRAEVLREYEAALDRLQRLGDRADPGRAEATLARLGLGGLPRSTAVAALSGGQKTRLALALVLLSNPQLLLLDEPTNHLDIPSRTRFEQALTSFAGAALAIVHDRYFIERFATRVWKVEGGTVREYVDLEAALKGKDEGRRMKDEDESLFGMNG